MMIMIMTMIMTMMIVTVLMHVARLPAAAAPLRPPFRAV
jgi:hypothetical protein